jgi:hypothetical protein
MDPEHCCKTVRQVFNAEKQGGSKTTKGVSGLDLPLEMQLA